METFANFSSLGLVWVKDFSHLIIARKKCQIFTVSAKIWHFPGPSVIIGFEEIHEYQWFAGRQQEVFIPKS